MKTVAQFFSNPSSTLVPINSVNPAHAYPEHMIAGTPTPQPVQVPLRTINLNRSVPFHILFGKQGGTLGSR